MNSLLTDIRVGWYLALRQVRRASKWTTTLIVFVMVLTFLDLVVVTGVLVGLIDGITNLYRTQETGDVILTALDNKNYIENSAQVAALIRGLPQVETVTERYSSGGTIEANYQEHAGDLNTKTNETGASFVGIDPDTEQAFGKLAGYVKEGSYLSENDYDAVLLGSLYVDRYSFGKMPSLTPLENVYPGSKVRVTINGNVRDMTVRGILVSTANSPIAQRIYMPANELRLLMGRTDNNVDEIAILLKSGADSAAFRDTLLRSGVGDVAKVQTFDEAIPNGVGEVKDTFAQIGNAIGSVGLVVASITIFIVIFINALTRRKFIGILKGIGVTGRAIETSYVFQSLFYALIGSGVGLLVLYGFLVPYVSAHPIVLPISAAIIVAPVLDTTVRIALIVIATVIAGYIPSRMIVRKNTLDSILGRN